MNTWPRLLAYILSWNNKLKNFSFWLLDGVAIDWIFILFLNKKFPKAPRPSSKRQNEFNEQVSNLTGEALEIVVERYENLLAEEDKQRLQIESKAFSLLGITGVASGFIVGFAQFLFNNRSTSVFIQWIIVILYALIGISLIMIILLAWRAVIPGKEYNFMSPDPLDLLHLNKSNKEEIYRQLVCDLIYSYENNQAISIDKTTYVRGAQDWFRNTIMLLLFLLIPLAITTTPLLNPPASTMPVEVIILTPTTTPTHTLTPTNSPTPTPTYIPTLSPTPTSTYTPTLLPTPTQTLTRSTSLTPSSP